MNLFLQLFPLSYLFLRSELYVLGNPQKAKSADLHHLLSVHTGIKWFQSGETVPSHHRRIVTKLMRWDSGTEPKTVLCSCVAPHRLQMVLLSAVVLYWQLEDYFLGCLIVSCLQFKSGQHNHILSSHLLLHRILTRFTTTKPTNYDLAGDATSVKLYYFSLHGLVL